MMAKRKTKIAAPVRSVTLGSCRSEAGRAVPRTATLPDTLGQRPDLDRLTPRDAQTMNAVEGGDSAQSRHDLPDEVPPVAANTLDLSCPIDSDTQSQGAAEGDDGAHILRDAHTPISPVVAEIVQLWRMRQRWHRAEKALILQGRALCRAWTGGDKAEAKHLFDQAAKGEAADPYLAAALAPFLAGIAGFAPERAVIERRLRKLARSLPVWPWVAAVRGFGDLNLAGIVGEAGDVGGYRNPSCLWKRMGLAVIAGGRQRKVPDAAGAELHGYNPSRRCVAYLLGETLVKAGEACPYRSVYAERRARTAETHPDWTKEHSHNDAARVMTKRALRDLWRAWRDEPAPKEQCHPRAACAGSAAEASDFDASAALEQQAAR